MPVENLLALLLLAYCKSAVTVFGKVLRPNVRGIPEAAGELALYWCVTLSQAGVLLRLRAVSAF